MKDSKFGNQIRLWRKSKGLKKVEAAKIFGVTPETICHWESGKAQPPATFLNAHWKISVLSLGLSYKKSQHS